MPKQADSHLHMKARMVRIPHAQPVAEGTWFSFARGQIITRRDALFVLINGPRRARIETIQANNSEYWEAEGEHAYLP